ncbi:DNA-binding transcriptional regulator, MocR family, contains an aminotransferase domain [Leifsonia sp. 98AMF]|uniref:aminotransferase class I/II-fold pyridoxal phosphate-dependent enzyme n=1 Tax=unclassified Leifsonia TaxID=2663824 RepID=UPI0008799702|nr:MULTISPECIES: aminotransferase class I/II-fold pyridoxal phosphate-dependent enzyme [unclassified Leifsonia]SDH40121.1 DNA-binding transcriptional regulator, MocR family, contains an aminotransferase domain [Leifsonia sp. 197AMF]SDI96373.1 DNA-binding transcriptional regulator, MocR family, contains an aminotransferase domain [Leifsonia sp. 466MF]SDJ79788.1 DNA-binding transcriptional regulator, MocR family, contains an aminotransferase domain [Leifsonia sp. 157MF]SDN99684.1 DNA-binding tran
MDGNGITGATASEIAASVRALHERGALRRGDALPPVRELAAQLQVNRNTAVAAYRLLAQAGVVTARGRAGTVIAGLEAVAQEGYAQDSVLRDIGTGNPDPRRIPQPSAALAGAIGRPVLYGEPVIDPALEERALAWVRDDLPDQTVRITVTNGAVDAVERLLAQALLRDDAVALEDPCFLASIHTVRLGGYRAIPVPVDAEGMTVDGLRAALAAGVRAVICTPRAQNPTGATLSPARAAELRAVLADHPYVLVIEDDHFSMLSQRRYETLIGPGHRRFALIRSVSKFLGPDMCLAVAATDPETAERLAFRLSPGTTWVSHILQRLVLAQLTDETALAEIVDAGRHYAERNRDFAAELTARGLPAEPADGLNLWVELPVQARTVAERLMRRGWLARTGDEFQLAEHPEPSHHLRLTVHDLTAEESARLLDDLVDAAR